MGLISNRASFKQQSFCEPETPEFQPEVCVGASTCLASRRFSSEVDLMINSRLLKTVALSLLIAAGSGCAQAPAPEHVSGRLLAQPAGEASESTIAYLLAATGAKVHHKIDGINVVVLEVPEAAVDAVSQALQRSGRFTFVERGFIAHAAAIPNDPDFLSEWHLAKIQAPSGWMITTGSSGVPIAVIDSGADGTHPDLAAKLIPGWNFLTGTSNTADTGCSGGHGTAVAGAAAADTNNLTGVAGVGWANTIMPLV